MNLWKKITVTHRSFMIVVLVYFTIHLLNLTLLPIFNDESIYIDWGWSHTHMPGHLYDALLDAKQPLMIWLFGFFQNFFSDPLYAGRFTSVLIGSITLLGIYKLTIKLLNKHAAIIASFLYSIVPIFVFYNRQALLEAGIACVGIWSCIALINIVKNPSIKNSIALGTILAIGFFIKSSSLLFIVSATIILAFFIWKEKQITLLKAYGIALLTFFCADFLLFINPVFWETFHTNSRYAYTLSELFTFPVTSWINNLLGFFEIGTVFVTPVIFLISIIGIYLFYKKKINYSLIFLSFFLIALFLEILSGKMQGQRYLVSFLPFLVVPASYVLSLLWQGVLWKKTLVVLSLSIPFVLTVLLIFNPEEYITQSAKFSKFSDVGYIRGQTSGHGINQAMQYIKDHSKNQPAMVLFGFNIGNPESAIDVYAQKTANLAPMHIDSQMFGGIHDYDCLTSQYPVYFVTRNDQRVGMDRYFTLEKKFLNPDPTYSVRIYTLKKNCTGKTTSLSDMYGPTMDKMFQMKVGIYY